MYLYYFCILNKKGILYIYVQIQIKQTKIQIKCKNGWKNVFNIFYILAKKNKSETKRKSQKMIKINTMGQGGASVEKWCK